ncbi:MAG: patatin-like phospholipase family protein [Shimia sp.]
MTIRLNLALQGGGAHGAFTWGVLDRLLDDEGIEVAAITGTSAGALNGAAFKAGLIQGGREGARENLRWLWNKVGRMDDMRVATWMASMPGLPLKTISQAIEYSAPFSLIDAWTRMMSPYAYGPFYDNPLRRIVEEFTWDEVCADAGPDLFVCATNVRSGKVRVFHDAEIGVEPILASACLPTLFKAVEIDGEAYWDGGYTGNPALFPVFAQHFPDDILIININPLCRDEVPKSPQEIQNRINEISFNTSLLRELRAIEFVQRLIEEGGVTPGNYKHVKVHMVADDDLMGQLSVATKLIPTGYVIEQLMEAGRAACGQFLDAHRDDLGKRSTVDLNAMFN